MPNFGGKPFNAVGEALSLGGGVGAACLKPNSFEFEDVLGRVGRSKALFSDLTIRNGGGVGGVNGSRYPQRGGVDSGGVSGSWGITWG